MSSNRNLTLGFNEATQGDQKNMDFRKLDAHVHQLKGNSSIDVCWRCCGRLCAGFLIPDAVI
ncbi:hypothetical protein Patl1_36755 [Pistacia atlantica]|nr:hypothetical protein Patl1_36755 [Pistacia atlantica]